MVNCLVYRRLNKNIMQKKPVTITEQIKNYAIF